jgi:hypothetical protein
MESAMDKPGMDAYTVAGPFVIGALVTSIALIAVLGGQM